MHTAYCLKNLSISNPNLHEQQVYKEENLGIHQIWISVYDCCLCWVMHWRKNILNVTPIWWLGEYKSLLLGLPHPKIFIHTKYVYDFIKYENAKQLIYCITVSERWFSLVLLAILLLFSIIERLLCLLLYNLFFSFFYNITINIHAHTETLIQISIKIMKLFRKKNQNKRTTEINHYSLKTVSNCLLFSSKKNSELYFLKLNAFCSLKSIHFFPFVFHFFSLFIWEMNLELTKLQVRINSKQKCRYNLFLYYASLSTVLFPISFSLLQHL